MIATFTTKAIVGKEVGQKKKQTNKSRGTLIFMRENTHRAAATVGGKKQQTLWTTLKMRDIHFSTSSRVLTRGRREESSCAGTRGAQRPFLVGNSISQSNDWASFGGGRDVCLGNVSINSFVERCGWPLMMAILPLSTSLSLLPLQEDDVSIWLSCGSLPGINKSNQLETINNTNSARSVRVHFITSAISFQRYFIW